MHMTYELNRAEHKERWVRLGANFILHAADIIRLAEGIRRVVGDLKRRLGDAQSVAGPEITI